VIILNTDLNITRLECKLYYILLSSFSCNTEFEYHQIGM